LTEKCGWDTPGFPISTVQGRPSRSAAVFLMDVMKLRKCG
jgi:hypothetical protein